MSIEKLDHYTIRTADLAATERFYTDVLGLAAGPRPAFSFPGLWLYQGSNAVVHVIGVNQAAPAATGPIDHVAFMGSGLDAMRERFKGAGVPFQERTVPTLNLRQVFLDDPNGVRIELNFPA